MNRRLYTYYLIILSGLLFYAFGYIAAQSPYSDSFNSASVNSCERITMFTDRDMYAVNEPVRFRAFYSTGDALEGKTWSRVLYVELVTPTGLAVAGGKYSLNEKGSSGSLVIPGDALTGNYFLRGYTRWMRNFGPGSFCYIPLKIINPFSRDVFESSNGEASGTPGEDCISQQSITCTTDQVAYSPGEEVQLELILSGSGSSLPGNYCLTVFPAELGDTLPARMLMDSPGPCDEFRFDHLPDIRGISISGTVVGADDRAAAPYARVHFSLMSDRPEYFATLADDQGRFIVNLPDRSGRYELFVVSEPSGDVNRIVRVDQDFATVPVPYGNQPFILSKAEEQAATRMIRNMQLSLIFGNRKEDPVTARDTSADIPFYGIPGITILTAEYVDLPTMTEVFENLITEVNILYRRGEPYLRIESLNSNINSYPPLLLVDQIPVFDLKTFLSVDPLKIAKIEVVNEVFVRGNITWGGIIRLTSKKGEMAAVDLPEGSYFIDYQAFCSQEEEDIRIVNTNSLDKVPDTRNTLLWIDDLALQPGRINTLQFVTTSEKGEYTILVRGVSDSGNIHFGTGKFTIR